MTFRVDSKTLERLEWPALVARWRHYCRTPQARAYLAAGAEEETEGGEDELGEATATDVNRAEAIFEKTLAGVRLRLRETSEARSLCDADVHPPIGSVAQLSPALRRAEVGGVLTGRQLLDIGNTLQTLHALRRFCTERREESPCLADLAETIEPLKSLEREIDTCIDSGGEVQDAASSALRSARRESQQLAGQLQQRLAKYLQDADVGVALSDKYYTVRNDRYVLPVRSDARRAVRGIVHDASNSGNTLFIEPEAVVDLNNRLKQAELEAEREAQRILSSLSRDCVEHLPVLRANLESLTVLDLAFARGRLSHALEAVEPQVEQEGIADLPQLRHPLLTPEEAVPNDLTIGGEYRVLVISGPNAGGKTVTMKAVALAALCARAGLHVCAGRGARMDLFEDVLADIGDEQSMRESLSTFSAHMANLSRIVRAADRNSLVVLDEVGVGTDPGEGAALAQAVLEALSGRGARVITTTHYNLLKEMAEVEEGFRNASVEFDRETLAPTYRLHVGTPGSSSAATVAARMGMPSAILERANALLEREDRQLDRMLIELASSRASLEEEQRRVTALRDESEGIRDEYRSKLERMQRKRDDLYRKMREDLDRAFKDAHTQVGAVIRDLQRGGTAQAAAHARERIRGLEERTREAEEESGVRPAEEERFDAIDWNRARPGDPVRMRAGATGVLVSLPDRKGRVTVQAGSAKLVVPTEQVGSVETATRPGAGGSTRPQPARIKVEGAAERADDSLLQVGQGIVGGVIECDLRGQRVDEALDEVDAAVDRATAEGRDRVRIIHGFGTGKLRRAVRDHLRHSGLVDDIVPGAREEGGDGVTVAHVRR